ncbi:hypothetical protein ACWC9T_37785 [Kitasatospora sp. NPDC001159]
MQREIAKRLPDRLVRRRPRAQQALELAGGRDLENAERAEDISAQGGSRAVGVGRAAGVRSPASSAWSWSSSWRSWSGRWRVLTGHRLMSLPPLI